MRYSKKVSKDGVFKCIKNEPISQCENHEILSVTQEGKYNTFFITYKCKIHDEIIKRAKGHVLSKGCVACVTEGLRKSREKLFHKRLNATETGDEFELISEYKTARIKVEIRHKKCGNTFKVVTDSFLNSMSCPHCTNSMYNAETFDKYYKKYKDFYLTEGFEILKEKPSKKMVLKTKFKVKHITCGITKDTTHGDFYHSGSRCSVCNNKNSRVHAIVCAILDINNIDFEVEYRFEDCKNKYTLPFDFRINSDDGGFILIEVDGQQHHKDMKNTTFKGTFERTQKNDMIKNKYCKDKSISLHRLKVEDYKSIEQVFNAVSEIVRVEIVPDYKIVDKFNTNKILHTDAIDIRESYLDGVKVSDMAKNYDCSTSWIWKILKYKVYPDVLPDLKSKIQDLLSFNNHKPPTRDFKLLPYKEEVLNLRSDGLTYKKIANVYQVSETCVRKFIINNS